MASYDTGYRRAQARARNWPPEQVFEHLAEHRARLVVARRNEIDECSGYLDGLADLLRSPLPATIGVLGHGFQYQRERGSSWFSWVARGDQRNRIENQQGQFQVHASQGRCAAVTQAAPLLDWSSLHPLLRSPM